MDTEPAAQDRFALADLVATYADAGDTRDFDRLRLVFTPDATLDTGRTVRIGIEEILEAMTRLERYEATSHLLGQQLLEMTGPDRCEGLTHCQAHHLLSDGDGSTDRVMHIRYVDDFVRTAEGWRIRGRRLDVAWTDDRAVG